MILISLIEQTYISIINKTSKPIIKNYRKIPFWFLNSNLIEILKKTFVNENEVELSDVGKVINDYNIEDNANIEETEVIRITKEQVNLIKEEYSEYNYSVNDILIHNILKIMKKLSEENNNLKEYINVGIAIDNRKNIKKNIISITNYSSMSPFYVKNTYIDNRKILKNKLDKFKKDSKGVAFNKEFLLLGLFPLSIQKIVLNKVVKNMIIDMSCCGIQTTNVGEISRFINDFGNSLETIEFIGPVGKYGLPIISISRYKGSLSIYIRNNNKYKIASKIKMLLENEIGIV